MQVANDLNSTRRLALSIIPAKDKPDRLRMLAAGEADAMIASDTLLRSAVAGAIDPDKYWLFDSGLGMRRYGIMVRRGNEAFRDVAIAALHHVMKSGQFNALYDRWFTTPIPPRNINLNLPMSPGLVRKVAATK